MRQLVLHHEGAPLCCGITVGEIRKAILHYPDDDADLFQVWSVPTADSMSSAEEITERFALEWSKEFDFGDGIEPADYLARFPAFVRARVSDRLIELWNEQVNNQRGAA